MKENSLLFLKQYWQQRDFLSITVFFKRFNAEKIERANSKQIAEAIGIDSATVRRDFSYFGELGRRGFGYDVKKLMNFFADLLNDNSITNVMLVGIGNMGHASSTTVFMSVTR